MSMHTKASVMEQAQVFASAWSLVGGIFDSGCALDDAEEAKDELAEMVGDVTQQRDDLLQALRTIANADTVEWNYPADFELWAKNRARAAIEKMEGGQ
jgi:hypothetical protein